jgi:hypothetical protein
LAKGRANPALCILVAAQWKDRPEVKELQEVGHKIHVLEDVLVDGFRELPGIDLILHPAAHGWHDSMWESPYLKAALTAGRKRHRERKKNA